MTVITDMEDRLTIPLKRKKPTVYTIWADLFHEDVPDTFIDKALAVMALSPQHLFPVLTKRAERLPEYLNTKDRKCRIAEAGADHITHEFFRFPPWPLPNFWPGISAEDQPTLDERVPHLLDCPAAVRWISLSPLLGPIDFSETVCADGDHLGPTLVNLGDGAGIDWIVIECEQLAGGHVGRLPDGTEEGYWRAVRSIIEQCNAAGVPVWHKQAPVNGKVSHDPSEWPEDTRRRDWPEAKPRMDST